MIMEDGEGGHRISAIASTSSLQQPNSKPKGVTNEQLSKFQVLFFLDVLPISTSLFSCSKVPVFYFLVSNVSHSLFVVLIKQSSIFLKKLLLRL